MEPYRELTEAVQDVLDRERALLGKRVRVTLSETDQVITIGKLLGFGDGGDFEILEDDGFVHYCWPMLKIEEVKPS